MSDLIQLTGLGPFFVLFGVLILALLASYMASRYKVAGANEAVVVAGSRGTKIRDAAGRLVSDPTDKGLKVVVGGGTFVLPLVHKVGKLDLTAQQISINLNDAVTKQGIRVRVQGVATFKIGRDVESLRNAAERFLNNEEKLPEIVKNVLEGSLRSIVGTLSVEQLISDRQTLQQGVQEAAKGDLETSGLRIDNLTIQSIQDESRYIDLIGQQQVAVAERNARMAKASADQEAAVREAEAEQIKIDAQRQVSIRRAEAEVVVQAANARAAQSGPLAEAEALQEVTRKQTELAQLAAERTEKELLAATVKPAMAERQAAIERAEGLKAAAIAAAQAEAERVRLAGQAAKDAAIANAEAAAANVRLQGLAEKDATLATAEADSQRVRLEGVARADAIRAQGDAEAQALSRKAGAYKEFEAAALTQTVLEQMPHIVAAAAKPMESIDSITVINSDGASEIVRAGTRTIAEAFGLVKGTTGLDVPGLINRAMDRSAPVSEAADGKSKPPKAPPA